MNNTNILEQNEEEVFTPEQLEALNWNTDREAANQQAEEDREKEMLRDPDYIALYGAPRLTVADLE